MTLIPTQKRIITVLRVTGVLLLISYVFWAINIPERFIFANITGDDLNDLVVVILSATVCYLIPVIIKKQTKIKRFALQIVLGTIIWVGFSVSIAWWHYTIMKKIPLLESDFLPIDLPLALTFFMIWSIYHLKTNVERIATHVEETKEKAPVMISAHKGSSNILLEHADIKMVYIQHKKTYITDNTNKNHYCDLKIGEVEELLPEAHFFRINRQVILQRSIIHGFDRIDHKKLSLKLKQDFPEEINLIVSREKSPAFKNWLRKGTVEL